MDHLDEKSKKYWEDFSTTPEDIEYLYNQLLELEVPQTSCELTSTLISHRLDLLETAKKQLNPDCVRYLPQETYKVGQTLLFENLDNTTGIVVTVRKGNNPQYSDFDVLEVEIGNRKRMFAARLSDHALNNPKIQTAASQASIYEEVVTMFGQNIQRELLKLLNENEDLVLIAGKWFPRSLLVHVNAGHLNLAEALLEEANGGPLSTKMIIDQVELPKDVNAKLIDFSIDLALQEDGRFDEVGAIGQTLWYLRRLEPPEVLNRPKFLDYENKAIDDPSVTKIVNSFEGNPCDEFEPGAFGDNNISDTSIALIFPHWRAGTLPLTSSLSELFPTSVETPRILLEFIDRDTGTSFPGWVVRPMKYVFGLSEWYQKNGLIPGSIIHLHKTQDPRRIMIWVDKKKQNREWIKSVIIGSDNEVVFAILKQAINASIDERLAIFIPEYSALDNIWNDPNRNRNTLEKLVVKTVRELSKLNPQGHVHAQELYAVINILRRCAPKPLVQVLLGNESISHVGDLYFRLEDA